MIHQSQLLSQTKSKFQHFFHSFLVHLCINMYVSMYVCMYVFFFFFFSIEVGAVTYLVENGWWFCGRNELGKWTHAPPHLSLSVGFDLGFLFLLLLDFCVCFLLRFLVLDSVRQYVEQVARDYWFSAKRVAPYVPTPQRLRCNCDEIGPICLGPT